MAKSKQVLRKIVLGMILLGVAGIAGGIGVVTVVAWQVYFGDDSALRKTTILAKIKEETTLYYLDEETRIGSIFEDQHRRYIPIDEVPPHVNNALIAAEDQNFYHHFGVDPIAIFKAVAEGVVSGGRFRRGGSTLTQQTVKNIMNDWEASFARKFREMIKAIQLERLYSKRQILEFYLNQFHVSGNGNGIGIAAKYYFDKPVHELTLVEGAFIAGSVKGPSKYNPFIKYTKEARMEAREFAFERKNYVLRRMHEQDWISKEELEEALKVEVPFKKGEFRTAEVALIELVKRQLEKPEILEALNLNSADDLNVAGLKVFTTLDEDMQSVSQLATRRNLSRLETILSGFEPESQEEFTLLRSVTPEEFYYGKVESITGDKPDNMEIRLNFGLPTGVIPAESIVRYGKLLDLAKATGWEKQVKEFTGKIKVGDILFVEVMEYDEETHEAVLELRKRPTINGGVIAIDKGEVRAVVSGFDTLGFNRSMYARKQPGSVFKSLVYFAAMQLGWSMLDGIDNERQMFPFQGNFYYPRPDHSSPFKEASMVWSGIKSENLSSVSLAYRLTEKLNFEQFKELMTFMGYIPEPGEEPREFHFRVSRDTGVSIDNKGIKEYQLQNAVEDIEPDLVFSGSNALLSQLKKMWWGEGYIAEMQRLYDWDRSTYSIKELSIRLDLIKNNFKRYEQLANDMTKDWDFLVNKFSENSVDQIFNTREIQDVVKKFRVLATSSNKPQLGYIKVYDGEEIPLTFNQDQMFMLRSSIGRSLNMLDAQAIWGQSGFFGSGGSAGVSQSDVSLDGKLPMMHFVNLQDYLHKRYEKIISNSDRYDLPRYYQHHDFRVIVGLKYLVKLGKAMGVFSPLKPVLSYPLGTNDVTVSEVAKIYQTFIEGKTYTYFDKGLDNQLTFIKRVEDRLGNILYEAKRTEHQLVVKESALQMREILRKIITHGTGTRARGELYVELDAQGNPIYENHPPKGEKTTKIRVPSFGKTGTTNDFTTSYFAGFVPYPTEKSNQLDPANSYVLASYVGYDDNRRMTNGRFKVYGSNGALPLWTDFAKGIIKAKRYGEMLDTVDLTVLSRNEWPLKFDEKTSPLMVDLPRGLVLRTGDSSDNEMWETTDLATTGESYQDYFALGSSVKSIVQVPPDYSSGRWQPLKMFSLYRQRSKEGEDQQLSKDSKITDTEELGLFSKPDTTGDGTSADTTGDGTSADITGEDTSAVTTMEQVRKIESMEFEEDGANSEVVAGDKKEELGEKKEKIKNEWITPDPKKLKQKEEEPEEEQYNEGDLW